MKLWRFLSLSLERYITIGKSTRTNPTSSSRISSAHVVSAIGNNECPEVALDDSQDEIIQRGLKGQKGRTESGLMRLYELFSVHSAAITATMI